MTIEAMKQALEALGCIDSPLHVREINKVGEAMKALRQAIEQAEKQEPVAWIKEQELVYMSAVVGLGGIAWQTNLGLKPEPGDVPLYTSPMVWIRRAACLTDEEIKEIVGPWGETPIRGYTRKLFDAIEAKLREKNV